MAGTMLSVQNNTTFQRSLPYGVGALGAGVAGAVLCASATATASIVTGVALAILGAYGFIGVLACGLIHSSNPDEFEKNVGKFMLSFAGQGLADLIATVAKAVVLKLISGKD